MSKALRLHESSVRESAPYSDDAEQAILGAIFTDNDALRIASVHVDEGMFSAKNRRVLRVMLALAERGDAIDPITVWESLQANGEADSVGGRDYIGCLFDAVPTAANVESHARIVRAKAENRRLAQILDETSKEIAQGTPVAQALKHQQQALAAAAITYGGATVRRIKLIDDEELEELSSPNDLIPGRLPAESLGQLFGPTGSLKSFNALEIAFCIATGTPCWGAPVVRKPVLYIVGEGIHGMKRRLAARKQLAGWEGRVGIHFLPIGIPIAYDSSALKELIAEIDALPEQPGLIIIDTLSRNFPGGSQNDDEAMNRFIAGCSLLKEHCKATVLAVHHTGWTELERSKGSSTWPQALDFEIRCDRDGSRVTLTWTKLKDDEMPVPVSLEAVQMGESLALKPMDYGDSKLDGNRLVCLSAVHRLDGGASFSKWREEAGLTDKKSSFALARSWLVERAYVKVAAGNKYTITDAGRMALSQSSPLVHSKSIDSPPSQGHSQSITQGSIRTPAMDQDPDDLSPDASASTEALSPEEEAEYWASVTA